MKLKVELNEECQDYTKEEHKNKKINYNMAKYEEL